MSANAVHFLTVALHGLYKRTNWQPGLYHFSSFRSLCTNKNCSL